jgi:HK97 family phage major capsid protein
MMSGNKDQKKKVATVRIAKGDLDAAFADQRTKFEDSLERHMKKAVDGDVPPNPALAGRTHVVPDSGRPAVMATPKGTGTGVGSRTLVSPEEALKTVRGFQALMQGDRAGAAKAWQEISTRQLVQSDEQATGGVLVPDGFLAQVISELPNFTPFADPATVRTVPMGTPVMKVPKQITKPAEPDVVQEATAYPETAPVWGHVELVARKIGEIIPITEEMVMGSSIALFGFLAEMVAEQSGQKRTDLITNGDGVSEPQGIRSEADVASYSQAATALASDDIIETYHAIASQYRDNAIWLMHDSIAKAVRKLTDSYGRYMWTDGGGLGPAQSTLLGRPVYENPKIPTNLGGGSNESVIIFGSFRLGYWLGQMDGLAMSTDSSGADWKADITNLKFRERWDGKVAVPVAFVIADSIVE